MCKTILYDRVLPRTFLMSFIALAISPRKISPEGELLGFKVPRLGEQIGAGNHGTVFRGVLDNHEVAFKAYNSLLTRLITNPARAEYASLSQAHSDLRPFSKHIQQGLGWYHHTGMGPVLVSRLVTDFDGTPSKSLLHTPTITADFMKKLSEVISLFPKFNLFFHATAANILVRRLSPTESTPVLIDLANYDREWRYLGHALTSTVSPEARPQRIQRWAENTLRHAALKVRDSRHDQSLSDLRLPEPDSTHPTGQAT